MTKSKKNMRISTLSGLSLIASMLTVLYFSIIASDRYISEAHIIIQSTDLSSGQSFDLSSLLSGMSSSNNAEQLLLRDYLLSVDILKTIDAKLDLRSHYSDPHHDLISRMWSKDEPLEDFYDYYLSRVSIEFDDYAGVLVIQTQAFDAKTAHEIAASLVEAGETFMNQMSKQLAQEQVNFLDKELARIKADTLQSRQDLLNYQNKNNIASPQSTAENVVTIINQLESQLTDLQTQKAGMLGYLMPNSSHIAEINLQIDAVEKQIVREKARLTSNTNKTLNRTVEEYQRLEMNAEFAQEVYKTALTSLEMGRFEAARTQKKMSILQQPTYPEKPLEPKRIYNSIVSLMFILLVTGIIHLFAAIIRDHKD